MKFIDAVKEADAAAKKVKKPSKKEEYNTGKTSEPTGFTGGTGDGDVLSKQPKNWAPKKK